VVWDNAKAMAESLAGLGKDYDLISPKVGIFLGNIAQHHPRYSEIYSLAEAISALCGATFGVLSDAANRVGMDLAGVLPKPGALNARSMLEQPRSAYLLVNIEPELDSHNAKLINQALNQSSCVVALTAYKSDALRDADVLLPIAPFTETSGTFTSMEGRVQSFAAAVRPQGECRPGWKVLRVLGNLLGLQGFDYESSEQIKDEILGGERPSQFVWKRLNNNLRHLVDVNVQVKEGVIQRVGEVPLYQSDAIVRRAPSLQKTHKSGFGHAAMNARMLAKLGLQEGDQARVDQAGASAILPVRRDDRVHDDCVRIPMCPETAMLGDLYGELTVEKA
jgi:NADH-quinone oxidoreductase subunit G